MLYFYLKKASYSTLALAFVLMGFSIAKAQSTKKQKKDYVVTIKTEFGEISLVLFEETPKHKENFLTLVEEKFYDQTIFHRVINKFMIQGGDPNTKPSGSSKNVGSGSPGYTIEAEFVNKYKHDRGMLAAARMNDRVNPEKRSSGSQFYIVQGAQGAHHLDGAYTIFGQVIKGIEIVDVIARQQVKGSRPVDDIAMTMEAQFLKKKKIKKLYGYTYDD